MALAAFAMIGPVLYGGAALAAGPGGTDYRGGPAARAVPRILSACSRSRSRSASSGAVAMFRNATQPAVPAARVAPAPTTDHKGMTT